MVPAQITESDFDAQLDTPVESAPPPALPATEAEPHETETSSEHVEESSPESEAGRTLSNARKRKDPEQRKASIQQEINALTREKGDSQRERDAIRQELAALRAERDSLKPSQAAPVAGSQGADPEPTEDQFETYGAYVKAQARWEARQEIKAAREQDSKVQHQQTQQRYQAERIAKHAERLDAFRAKRPDFDEVIGQGDDLPYNRPMQDAIFDSDLGPELLLYLAEHPDDHRRIYALQNPRLAYREMSKLEARLEAAASGPAPVVNVSQAKPPLKPVGSAPSTGDSDEPAEDDDMDTFIAKGNRAEQKRKQFAIR